MKAAICIALIVIVILVLCCAKCWCGCDLITCLKNMKHGCCKEANHSNQSFTPGNFINTTRQVTLYYADWCPSCKNMRPIWEQVKNITKDSGIKYIESDQTTTPSPGIDTIPRIIMIDEYGKSSTYNGPANVALLRNWITSPIMQVS